MKRPYQLAGAVFLLIAAYVARESLELRYSTPLGPGPGFFPLWLSVALGLLATAMIYQATFRSNDLRPPDFFATRSGYVRLAVIVGAIAGTVALMVPLGFRLTMLAFYLVLLNVLGRPHVLTVGLVALGGSFGVYYLFVELLRVPLPVGSIGF